MHGPPSNTFMYARLQHFSDVAVFHARGVPPPLREGRVFSSCGIHFGVGYVGPLSQQQQQLLG